MEAASRAEEEGIGNAVRSRSRRPFSLSEKIAIVRETLVPGVTASHVARRHGIHLNLIYYWRRVYKDLAEADLEVLELRHDADRARVRKVVQQVVRVEPGA